MRQTRGTGSLTGAEVRKAGELVYGKNWQTRMAAEIGVTDRTVRRWAGSDAPLSADLRNRLLVLLRAQVDELSAAVDRLSG